MHEFIYCEANLPAVPAKTGGAKVPDFSSAKGGGSSRPDKGKSAPGNPDTDSY